jgi:hypothetical protein
MKHLIAVAALLALAAGPAHATANVSCDADDAQLKLDVQGLSGRQTSSPIFDLKAAAVLKSEKVPEAFRSIEIQDHLVQRWTVGEEFKMHFNRQSGDSYPLYELDLVIDTSRDEQADDLAYKGSYTLNFRSAASENDPNPVEIPATCYND